MKTSTLPWFLTALLLAGAVARAQTTIAANDAREREEAVILSPFVVNTEKDVGFVAASSLAGGRLAANLSDTPTAYSVLTREFLDALDLTDLVAASEWTVNSVNTTGAGDQEIFGNGFETTTRGVTASPQQRNFFPLNVNLDSYNLDRFDYSRGPNAILFGNGTFGGTANALTKIPQFNRPFTQIKATYGSWDKRRVTLDENRPLTDRFAVRVNALWQDQQGWRDFEMEARKAITLSGRYKFAKDTELAVEGEVGRITRNNPPTFLNDQITGWDGKTVFDRVVTNSTVPANSVLQLAGVQRYGSDTSPVFIFAPDLGMTTVENYANTFRSAAGGSNQTTAPGGIPLPAGAAAVNMSGRPILDALNEAPWRFDRAVANSHFRIPEKSFAISTLTPTLVQNFQSYTTSLRHRVGENLYLETAGNISREVRRTNYLNARSLNDVNLDLMKTLPNGAVNPYFLDVFGQGQRSRGTWGNDYANARVTAAYTLERTRFGNYLVNLMGGLTKQTQFQSIESMRVLRDGNPRNWPFNDQVFYRYYWNGPTFYMPEIRQATLNGVTYPVGWIVDSQRPTDISHTDSDVKYLQGAVKGAFFSNRLHVIGAFRFDRLLVQRTINDNYGDYPVDWDGRSVQYRLPAPPDYLTLPEIRPRDSNRIPTVTADRYQDDYNPPDIKLNAHTFTGGGVYHVTRWMSVFGNYATSFNPSTSQLRLDGSIMPSPESSGWDAGLRFNLVNNRLHVSATYYEGKETAQSFEINFTAGLQNIAYLNKLDDLVLENNNQRGLPVVPRQAFDRRDRENHGYEFEITANATRDWRLSANAAVPYAYQTNAFADTRAFMDKYYQTIVDVLKDGGVNVVADGRAVTDSSIPNSRRAGGNTTEANAARDAWNNIFINQIPNIVTGKQVIAGGTKPVINFYSDYRFSSGWLKGIRFGAGMNYRGKKVIGYRGADTIQDPAQPNNLGSTGAIDDPNVDAYTPIYSAPYTLVTATLGYTFKLRERHTIQLQFRVANLLNDTTAIYTGATVQRPPNGDYTKTAARVSTPVNYRWETPRNYTLTATYGF